MIYIYTVFIDIVKQACICKLNETGCPTLLDSIFPSPEKPECGDSGLEALSKGFGGDVWPGCAGKFTKRDKNGRRNIYYFVLKIKALLCTAMCAYK